MIAHSYATFKFVSRQYMPIQNVLELSSLVIFFAVYKFFGIIAATFALMTCTLCNILFLYLRYRVKQSKMIIFSATILFLFGGLSLITNDARFIKIKPTILYGTLAVSLAIGTLFNKYFIGDILKQALDLSHKQIKHKQIKLLTIQWIVIFTALAVANEITWRNFSEDIWINFKVFVTPILLVVISALQLYCLRGNLRKK